MLEVVTALQLLALFSMVKVVTASLYSLCLPMLEIVTALFLFFTVLALFTDARDSHRTVLLVVSLWYR